MTTTLLVIQFLLTVIITISVLLQKSSSIGLGAYSGSNESLFGAKGPAGFLAKFKAIMGLLFVLNALALGHLYQKNSSSSLLENYKVETPLPSTLDDSKLPPKAPSL